MFYCDLILTSSLAVFEAAIRIKASDKIMFKTKNKEKIWK